MVITNGGMKYQDELTSYNAPVYDSDYKRQHHTAQETKTATL